MSTTPSNPSLNPQEIRQILDALEQSEWDEAMVTVGDVSISLARNGARLTGSTSTAASAAPSAAPSAPVPAPAAAPIPVAEAAAPTPVAAAPAGTGEGIPIPSPTVGIFWRSPEPGAAPFVEVGQQVRAGDTVCIVEVMKLMNNISAPVSGTITGIAIENASSVEFDQVLMTIAPEGS